MDGFSVHFEVYVRRIPGAPWTLELATENRAKAVETAEELMAEGRIAAARVSKETFDEETREFKTVIILKLGAAETAGKSKPQLEVQPLEQQPLAAPDRQPLDTHAGDHAGALHAWT